MPYKKFISAYEAGPLSYLISTRKALPILLVQKIRDERFRLLLVKWACVFLFFLGAGICGFYRAPMFLALGVVAQAVCLFALLLWVGIDSIFLKFALEDERFYELAIQRHALSIFEDADLSLPQPRS